MTECDRNQVLFQGQETAEATRYEGEGQLARLSGSRKMKQESRKRAQMSD